MRPHGEDHFIVRSPALLGLADDWLRTGVPLAEVLAAIEVLTAELGALARTIAGLITGRIWPSATTSAGDLTGLLQRGRPLLLQAVASTLADRLGSALAERAEATGDARLRAALDDIRVGAVTDSQGTIHRPGGSG